MGTVNIVQFNKMSTDDAGNVVPVADTSVLTSENVTSGASSTQSSTLLANTRIIRIATDTTIRVLIGSNPTALSTSMRMLADTAEYFGVTGGNIVAVIDE